MQARRRSADAREQSADGSVAGATHSPSSAACAKRGYCERLVDGSLIMMSVRDLRIDIRHCILQRCVHPAAVRPRKRRERPDDSEALAPVVAATTVDVDIDGGYDSYDV